MAVMPLEGQHQLVYLLREVAQHQFEQSTSRRFVAIGI